MNSKEIVIMIIVLAFVVAIIVDKKNYILEADEITITYTEELPEENFSITKTSDLPFVWNKKVPVSNNMFKYDKEFIGTQDAVFKYEGEEVTFKLTILPKKLDSPTISFTNNKVMWSSVKGASGYQVFINNEGISVTTTEFSLDDHSLPAGDLSIGVRAKTQNEKYVDSESSNLLHLRKLEAVNDILYQNGNLSWKAIEGAAYYKVFVNNVEYTTKENKFSVADFAAGNNIVKIVAVSDEPFVIDSEISEKKFIKCQVKNIAYRFGSICWETAPGQGQCTYRVIIDGSWYETNSNDFKYFLENDVEHNISVQALPLSAQSIESDVVETMIIYKKLEKPEASILLGDYKDTYTIRVSEVKNADSYRIDLTLYSGSGVLKRNYTINSLEKDFDVAGNVSRIVAEVVATDSKGQYMDSDVLMVEKIIR